jgi:hypothetical protein
MAFHHLIFINFFEEDYYEQKIDLFRLSRFHVGYCR